MLDLSEWRLPQSIKTSGGLYPIHTDFRFFLKLQKKVRENETLTLSDFDPIFNTTDRPKTLEEAHEAVKAITDFMVPKRELPRPTGDSADGPVLDYEIDGALIYAAFYQVYGIDLFKPGPDGEPFKLHWWLFTALLDGITGTKLNDVMGFRSYDENDKGDSKKFHRKMKNAWRIETKLTEAEQKELDAFSAQFN